MLIGIWTKIYMIVLVALFVAVIILQCDGNKSKQELNKANDRIRELVLQIGECNVAIEKQNVAVESIKVDTLVLQKQIVEVKTKWQTVRDSIYITVRGSGDDTSAYKNDIARINYAIDAFFLRESSD